MRGGPRMMCSPYLTGSLALMLVLVTFNYWSVSTNNFDLVKEVKLMQTQLKTGSGTIQERERETAGLKEELKTVRQALEKCRGEKATLESVKESLKICNTEKQTCESDKVSELEQARKEAKKVKDNMLNESAQLKEEKEALEIQRRKLEEELKEANNSIADLRGEVSSLRAEQLKPKSAARPALRLTGGEGVGEHGRGQLPDVDPKAVSVVQKETRGMVFHLDPSGRNYLPILPRGNPKAPRPPPLHSVMELGQGRKESIDAPPRRTTKSKEDLQSPKDSPPILSPKPEKDPGSSRSKRHLPIAGSGGIIEPLPPGGPSSPKPRGISSSSSTKSGGLVDNIGGVMPVPNNLDQAEDDAHIPEHKNGPDGNTVLEDDDQDPDGQIDETVDPEKQQFLQEKALKDETKDIVVEGSKEGVGKGKRDEQEDINNESVNRSGSFKVET